jgi:flagellar basal-body rod protein FlgG
MLKSLYTAATGMNAQQTRMDVIANNLANASTTGFKKARAEFDDLLAEQLRPAGAPDPRGGGAPAPLEVGAGVRLTSTTRSNSQGDMVATNNPYDLAIEGPGFFQVQRPSGEMGYTRAGNLRSDALGRLVTAGGEVIDPAITLPSNTTAVLINPQGKVTAQVAGRSEPIELGTLELVTFANPGGLQSAGNNILRATDASGEPLRSRPGEEGAGSIAQGYLETSNVKAVEEMIDMIVTQRAFEMNSKVIQTGDQMLQKLTSMR